MNRYRQIRLEDINYPSVVKEVLRNIWVAVIVAIAAWMLVTTYARVAFTPQYTSSVTFVVSTKGTNSTLSSLNMTNSMAEVFSTVFESEVLRAEVLTDMGMTSSDYTINAEIVPETNLLKVTVVADTPEEAFRALTSSIRNYDSISEYMFQNTILTVLKDPSVPKVPSNSFATRSTCKKAAAAAFVLVVVVMAALSAMRETVQTKASGRHNLEGQNFGSISHDAKAVATVVEDEKLEIVDATDVEVPLEGEEIAVKAEAVAATESVTGVEAANETEAAGGADAAAKKQHRRAELKMAARTADPTRVGRAFSKKPKVKTAALITNPLVSYHFRDDCQKMCGRLEYTMKRHGEQVVMISSAGENEGKSTVAANLALALSSRKKSVLLVDCDFRKPAVHKIFGVTEEQCSNFSDYLIHPDKISVDDVIVRTELGIDVATNHKGYRMPQRLIVSGQMQTFIETMKNRYDYIVIDSPPMLVATDAEALTQIVDVSMLVVRQDWTFIRDINDCISYLQKGKARYVGYVLNNFAAEKRKTRK